MEQRGFKWRGYYLRRGRLVFLEGTINEGCKLGGFSLSAFKHVFVSRSFA